MRFFTKPAYKPTSRFFVNLRIWLASAIILCLTPLLIHPSVPQLLQSVHDWGATGSFRNFGYLAHMLAYFVMSLLVLAMLHRNPIKHVVAALAIMILHGIGTELTQLFVPGREFDLLDMTCNIFSVLTAGMVWHLNSRQLSGYSFAQRTPV